MNEPFKTMLTLSPLFLILFFQCCTAKADDNTPLARYAVDFLPEHREAKALEIVKIVEAESAKHGVDPLLVGLIISLESSWRTKLIGGIGERGLMQVVPGGVCARGHNLNTITGQIQAGVGCLALSRDQCNGTLKQTLTMYASGRCVSESRRTQRMIERRVRKYKSLKLMYR